VGEHGLSEYDAAILTGSKPMAEYYEAVARAVPDKKVAANWVIGEVAAALNDAAVDFTQPPVPAQLVADLIVRVLDGTINNQTAKSLFKEFVEGGSIPPSGGTSIVRAQEVPPNAAGHFVGSPGVVDAFIEKRGLKQISDTGELEAKAAEVIATNPKQVEDYRAGKEKALNSLVGQVMKATQGKANPAQVTAILKKKIAG